MTGLLVMAEDQPSFDNRVALDGDAVDDVGMPRPVIAHRHSERDLAAVRALASAAKAILSRAGAILFYVHPIRTFSHALGTVRMGDDPKTAPLDRHGAFRGVTGLYVADASALPRSGAVNPSLTIAANAWRIGDHIARSR
jgi:choline dehydrogenase-like flavoprotein